MEQKQRLSQSILWQIQRDFYEQQGVEAWGKGIIPHYITSNPFIANAYAEVVLGFIEDCVAADEAHKPAFAPLDSGQPLYIVELGSGTGRFGFLFLRRLLDIVEDSLPAGGRATYVMTDFSERNVTFWQNHPLLQPYLERGVLDFARFDMVQDEEISLTHSGVTLRAGQVANPMVVLANYVFDSIPLDMFRIEDGLLYESLVSLSTTEDEPDLHDPDLLDRITLTYEHIPVKTNYYEDVTWNHILDRYVEHFDESIVRLPTASLQCCQFFHNLAGGRLLLLASDRGYIHADVLEEQDEDGMGIHGGGFSMPVNFHAIGEYFRLQDGQVLHSAHEHYRIVTAAFLLGKPPGKYAGAHHAFADAIAGFGPDDFYILVKGIESTYDTMTVAQILALLRLSGWDSKILYECLPSLTAQVNETSQAYRRDILATIERVWQMYYHIGEANDLPYAIGMLLFKMREYAQALTYFEQSRQLYESNPHVAYSMALCHVELGQVEQAVVCTEETLTMLPAHDGARTLLSKLRSQLPTQMARRRL